MHLRKQRVFEIDSVRDKTDEADEGTEKKEGGCLGQGKGKKIFNGDNFLRTGGCSVGWRLTRIGLLIQFVRAY